MAAIEKDELDYAILTIVEKEPGIRLYKLGRELNRSQPMLKNRLLYLELAGEITTVKGKKTLQIYRSSSIAKE